VGAQPISADLQTGDTLGPYVLGELLGKGAMGCVFLARRHGAGEPVALKLVRVELASDDRYRRRFLHEARAASEVQHRHLVDVLDAGEVDGRQYLAMRLVRGPKLEQRIAERGPMAVDEIVRITGEIGGALEALHAVGLIHRDVKSSNIMLDDDDGGAAALTDFGLAKGTGYARLTRPGQVLGTISYLAPERIRGEDASPASDVYGLGCVVYECLTGAPPFTAKSMMEIAFSHLQDTPVDPSAGRSDVHSTFGEATLTALEKEPGDRPRSAMAYADLLRSAAAY
jgi:serine/threonine protein kinase